MRASFLLITLMALVINSSAVLGNSGKIQLSRVQQVSSWVSSLFSPATVRNLLGATVITIAACTQMLGCSESNNPVFNDPSFDLQSEEGRSLRADDRAYFTFASTGKGKQLNYWYGAMGVKASDVSYYEQNRELMTVADYDYLFVHYRKDGLDFAGRVKAEEYVNKQGGASSVPDLSMTEAVARSIALKLRVYHFDHNPERLINVDNVVGIYVIDHADYDLGRVYVEWDSSASTIKNNPLEYYSLSSPPPLTWLSTTKNLKFSGVVGIAFTSNYNILVIDTVEDDAGNVYVLEDYERFPLAVNRASMKSISP